MYGIVNTCVCGYVYLWARVYVYICIYVDIYVCMYAYKYIYIDHCHSQGLCLRDLKAEVYICMNKRVRGYVYV
jgi:hypothetical protein